MNIIDEIKQAVAKIIIELYGVEVQPAEIVINATKEDFEGDYTVVLFGFIKKLKRNPESTGKEIGDRLMAVESIFGKFKTFQMFSSYNLVKGFLNLVVSDEYWLHFLQYNFNRPLTINNANNSSKVMVEFSSPNTNKPLHLGHLRNIFLGWSTAEILQATGNDVIKSCIYNDRGIHICKSMVAWQLFGNHSTPENTGIKGDHLVGDYYVMFGAEHKKQIQQLLDEGMNKEDAEKNAPIMKAAQQMLVDWEAGKPDVVRLWSMMNSWVYKGFDETYKRIGVWFDKVYHESDTYILGKQLVEEGLGKNVFYKEDDGSVWIDLTADGLDKKIVQRRDGTAVYITQDIGLAVNKYEEYKADQSIYVVGDEQNYHFKVLKLICKKLGLPSAGGIYHLSYGMVELPTGRMKTREGTVVDADDIMDEMIEVAKLKTQELGKVKDFTEAELNELYATLGIGALKFFILRVDPKKRIVFNPEESIEFNGFTGPFIQYTYARIKSVLRKVNDVNRESFIVHDAGSSLLKLEKDLLVLLEQFSSTLYEAAANYDPSKLAIYLFNLAQTFNSFYTEHSIANAESEEKKALRLQLSTFTSNTIKQGMHLLGIKVPERM